MNDLRKKIESAINSTSAENGSDTPDFILAEYLTDGLAAYDKAVTAREKWYERQELPTPFPSDNTTKSASSTSSATEAEDHETAEEKVAWLKILLVTKSCDPVFTDYWLRLARRNLLLGLPLMTPEPELNPTQPR
jgi:hypothetical protein